MSNSVIQHELTALVQEKNYFHFLCHQRILITGATGLIGSMFIKLLIQLSSLTTLANLHVVEKPVLCTGLPGDD